MSCQKFAHYKTRRQRITSTSEEFFFLTSPLMYLTGRQHHTNVCPYIWNPRSGQDILMRTHKICKCINFSKCICSYVSTSHDSKIIPLTNTRPNSRHTVPRVMSRINDTQEMWQGFQSVNQSVNLLVTQLQNAGHCFPRQTGQTVEIPASFQKFSHCKDGTCKTACEAARIGRKG